MKTGWIGFGSSRQTPLGASHIEPATLMMDELAGGSTTLMHDGGRCQQRDVFYDVLGGVR